MGKQTVLSVRFCEREFWTNKRTKGTKDSQIFFLNFVVFLRFAVFYGSYKCHFN
jgi:hypothetical protein